MRKFVFAFAAVALLGTSTFAAAPKEKPTDPPPPVPVYSWTGWYVGGNVGYGWGTNSTDLAGNGAVTSQVVGPNFISPFALTDSKLAQLRGGIGGGQLGYNYQFSQKWVLGFEADFQGSGIRGSGTFIDPVASFVCVPPAGGVCLAALISPLFGTALTGYQAKIDWFGTVRGRVGVLLNDGLLLFGSGGLAYGRVSASGNVDVNAVAPGFPTFTPGASAFVQSKTDIGFAVGGGLEGTLAPWFPPNWTWKLEDLYVDLGSLTATTPFSMCQPVLGACGGTVTVAGAITTRIHFTDNIVRLGLNYQFH